MNRALLVGINEYPEQPLDGCVNDVLDVANYLVGSQGFAHSDITMLMDSRASKSAIVAHLKDMIAASQPGDHVLFHFSGHGTQVPSHEVSEPDGLDEVLCPFDFDWSPATTLSDNEMNLLFASVPRGVALTCVIDACHSGDLQRELTPTGQRARFLRPPADVQWSLRSRRRSIARIRSSVQGVRAALVSACASNETAADTSFANRPNGAFTYYFLRALSQNGGRDLPLTAVVSAASASVATYGMHPVTAGPQPMVDAAFLAAPSAGAVVPQDEDRMWDAVLAEILRLARTDRQLRARFEAAAGLLSVDADPASLTRALKARLDGRRAIARTFWWGFHIEVSHEELSGFLPGANLVNDIVGVIGGAVGGPAAPFIAAIAGFIAVGLGGLQALDAGAGIYVSMSWFAPGVFVPTTVPVRGNGRARKAAQHSMARSPSDAWIPA